MSRKVGRDKCSAPDCENPNCSQGLCFKHYRRWQRHGSTELPSKPTICSVEGCWNKYRCSGLCALHYDRLRATGHLEPPSERLPYCAVEGCDKPVVGWERCEQHYRLWRRDTRIDLCSIDGCVDPARARGWCRRHYSRWKEHGSALWLPPEPKPKVKVRREAETYMAVHIRMRKLLGPARLQLCIDCGRQAREWSYDHADAAERIDPKVGQPFSADPSHYDPRCRHCHRVMDGNYKRHRAEFIAINLNHETMTIRDTA